jgi:hypothetical protein
MVHKHHACHHVRLEERQRQRLRVVMDWTHLDELHTSASAPAKRNREHLQGLCNKKFRATDSDRHQRL